MVLVVTAKSDDVVDVEPDADFFPDGMVVVRGDQRQYFGAARQPQRVEKLGAAKGAMDDLCSQRTVVVVDDIVRAQQHLHLAALPHAAHPGLHSSGNCGERRPSSTSTCRSLRTVPGRNTPWPMKSATNRLAGRW